SLPDRHRLRCVSRSLLCHRQTLAEGLRNQDRAALIRLGYSTFLMTSSTVRTRFAPSPTGFLHIGSVRTAFFNWLYARKHGGQYLLRIDDTDQQRNVAEALAPIFHGFRWLGLTWDEGAEVGGPYGPYYQSQKQPQYQEAARAILDKGLAYWDYAPEEEKTAERHGAAAAR